MTIGGLAYAYKVYTDEQAGCSGKDKDSSCEKKECDDSCLHKMDQEEEVISKANQDLEKVLKEIKPKALEATECALKVNSIKYWCV